MSAALTTITAQIRERVRREGIDLSADAERTRALVTESVRAYSERSFAGIHEGIQDEATTTTQILAALTGFGPLQHLLDDPTIEEIWVNHDTEVFVARGANNTKLDITLARGELADLVERMLAGTGRRTDLSTPFVDAALPDGSRLHVASGDVAGGSMSINIRKFSATIRTLAALVELGSLSEEAAAFLQVAVSAGLNILVSGPTHSGKTTMLNALLSAGRQSDRVVTVEETFELAPSVPDHVALQGRQASLEGAGEIGLRRLVKESLRMRPDRLVIGEVREAEALDLLIALNSGVPGMCTIHANSAREALSKLSTLPLLAGRNIDSSFIVPTVAATVDLVIQCSTDGRGNRRVVESIAPSGRTHGTVIDASELFALRDGLLRSTGLVPERTIKFDRAGIARAQLFSGPAL
ncbi:CpaF family protein [Humidisolicoccus flavus]|uniref:CpaF family protein n=1 Tax=Humidisolicoccus flavus TaxID=3111414 RepID=UPI00325645F8